MSLSSHTFPAWQGLCHKAAYAALVPWSFAGIWLEMRVIDIIAPYLAWIMFFGQRSREKGSYPAQQMRTDVMRWGSYQPTLDDNLSDISVQKRVTVGNGLESKLTSNVHDRYSISYDLVVITAKSLSELDLILEVSLDLICLKISNIKQISHLFLRAIF